MAFQRISVESRPAEVPASVQSRSSVGPRALVASSSNRRVGAPVRPQTARPSGESASSTSPHDGTVGVADTEAQQRRILNPARPVSAMNRRPAQPVAQPVPQQPALAHVAPSKAVPVASSLAPRVHPSPAEPPARLPSARPTSVPNVRKPPSNVPAEVGAAEVSGAREIGTAADAVESATLRYVGLPRGRVY